MYRRDKALRGECVPEKFVALRDIKAGEIFTRADSFGEREINILRSLTVPDRERAARDLRMTLGSFKTNVCVLCKKLGVHRSMQLVLWGIKHGIIHTDDSDIGSDAPAATSATGPQAASTR